VPQRGRRADLTLDTGALIALERLDRFILSFLATADEHGLRVTVPNAVLAEWWRGGRGVGARLLKSFVVEPLTDRVAMLAGEALGKVKGPSVVDAIVVASAAQRGDVVITSDYDDLDRLCTVFPEVRLVGL
jgi:predicted nucleic acid-binding protein